MSKEKVSTCFECGVKEGQYHQPGCFNEKCPFCGGQLVSCDCCYKHLKLIDKKKYTAATDFLSPSIYKNGLTRAQGMKWDKILKKKGLIPYIQYPIVCAYCGKLWPDMFMDDRWSKYIEPAMRNRVLCKECFKLIVNRIDRGTHGLSGKNR